MLVRSDISVLTDNDRLPQGAGAGLTEGQQETLHEGTGLEEGLGVRQIVDRNEIVGITLS